MTLFHPQGRLGRRLASKTSVTNLVWVARSFAPKDAQLAEDMLEVLQCWGPGLLFHFQNSGLKVQRSSPEEFSKREGIWNRRLGRPGKGAIYDASRKLIHLRDDQCLATCLNHELAHVVDELLTTHGWKFSTALWQGFRATRRCFPSNYAASAPDEYLAVSVEHFLGGQELGIQRNDPQMHRFLTDLFQASHEFP